ncbi:MAG: hypothetical protein HZC38_13740 [Chloroflexi bacterium]|nr:hypothetical protein [Chloroflexota bacterium]
MISKIPTQPLPFFIAAIRPAWRMMNTVIFLIAFFSPWLSSCNKTYNGFETTSLVGTMGIGAFSSSPIMGFYFVLIFIGLLCVGVYSLVSAVAIFIKYARRIAFIPLVISVISMVMIAIYIILSSSGRLNSLLGLLGGYWFTWIGLISSSVMELIEWVLIWTRPKKSATQ